MMIFLFPRSDLLVPGRVCDVCDLMSILSFSLVLTEHADQAILVSSINFPRSDADVNKRVEYISHIFLEEPL